MQEKARQWSLRECPGCSSSLINTCHEGIHRYSWTHTCHWFKNYFLTKDVDLVIFMGSRMIRGVLQTHCEIGLVSRSQSLQWVTSGLRCTVNSTNYFGSHQNICYKFNPIFTNLQHPKQRLCGMPFCGLSKELRYTNTHGITWHANKLQQQKDRNRKGGQSMSADTQSSHK